MKKINAVEQRADFEDYPASEQERDYQRWLATQQKDVYVLRVSGIWNCFIADGKNPVSISGEFGQDLTDFIGEMKPKVIRLFKQKPKFHCIRNQGIEEYLRERVEINKLLDNRSNNNGR